MTMYPIELTLQGARCCISVSKGVIKALGKSSHVSIKISDNHDSLSVFPCDESLGVEGSDEELTTMFGAGWWKHDEEAATKLLEKAGLEKVNGVWNYEDKPDGYFEDLCFIRGVS